MSSQMQTHLRKYVEDGIQQKVRLNNLALNYRDQENKSRERVIDQTTLMNQLQSEGVSNEKVGLIKERRQRDEDILNRVKTVLSQTEDEVDGITFRMNAHLEELSEIEIKSGGFVTHAVGVDKHASFDKDTKIISFKENGHVEIPIGTRRNNWRDSSQLTIQKTKK